jgi:hypothetical protein
VASADFQSGTVTDGWVTEFVVVPEPGTLVLATVGSLALVGWSLRRRLRSRPHAPEVPM